MSDQSPFEKKVIRRTPIDKPTPLTHNLAEALKRLKVDNPPVQTADKKQVKAKITKISKIVAKVSILGVLMPVAIIQPLTLDNVAIGHIELESLNEIKEKELLVGDTVIVQQTENNPPKIIRVVKSHRTGTESKFIMPPICPCCNSEIYVLKEQSLYRCLNISCPAQLKENIKRFVSENFVNISGLNDELISRLVEIGMIKNPADLYDLTKSKLLSLGVIQEKTVNVILNAIEKSRYSPLEKFILALGIDGVDEPSAQILAHNLLFLDNLIKISEIENISNIEGISSKIAANIKAFFFRQPANEKVIEKLSKKIITISSFKQIPLKTDWEDFKIILDNYGITFLYHFTDASNLDSIKKFGLLSWWCSQQRGVSVPLPGGNNLSRELDRRKGLKDHVRLSFVKDPPMLYVAKQEGRIPNPVILKINPVIIYWKRSLFSDINATDNNAHIGGDLESFKRIRFDVIKYPMGWSTESEKKYYQAEVLIEKCIPFDLITLPANN